MSLLPMGNLPEDLRNGELGEERLRTLAETKLNGRQIKNVMKPAQLLAALKVPC